MNTKTPSMRRDKLNAKMLELVSVIIKFIDEVDLSAKRGAAQ